MKRHLPSGATQQIARSSGGVRGLARTPQSLPERSEGVSCEECALRHVLSDAGNPDLMALFEAMLAHFGPRHWWPAETPTEMIAGAILTQSVSWRNVRQALSNLKDAQLLDFAALHRTPAQVIEPLVRPTRFYKAKTAKLKAFAAWVTERFGSDLDTFLIQAPTATKALRSELLAVHGIGPETADCILVYACKLPSFPVDAYTRRIFSRLGHFDERIGYEEMRDFFMSRLPADVALFNEYHALIDAVGHHHCAPVSPRCGDCPLARYCLAAT